VEMGFEMVVRKEPAATSVDLEAVDLTHCPGGLMSANGANLWAGKDPFRRCSVLESCRRGRE
jgi:hypothetical protein